MKATLLLRKDHERVHQLFEKFRKSNPHSKRAVFDEIRREVLIHSSIEAELFYPELQNTSSDRYEEIVAAASQDHKAIEGLLDEIAAAKGNDNQFNAKMTQLMESLAQHIEKEEEDDFAEARKILSEHKLEELGLEMETRKSILNQIAA